MMAAIFALAGALIGVLGTLAVELARARTEDIRTRREAIRLACADFSAAVARIRALVGELSAKPVSSEQMQLLREAHREARVHYERLRLISASQGVQKAGRYAVRYAYGLIRQVDGKSLRDDEKERGPWIALHDALISLYAEVRRETGVPQPDNVYREPDEWIDPELARRPTASPS